MSEMVERCAQAMWDASRWNPMMPTFAHERAWGDLWPPEYDWLREIIRVQARAAIEAMREPDPKMLHAAFVAMNETPSGLWKAMKAAGETPRRMFDVKMAPRWRAMIDAALNPGE